MAKKISIDQTGAWVLAVFCSVSVMGVFGFLVSNVGTNYINNQKAELLKHQQENEKMVDSTEKNENSTKTEKPNEEDEQEEKEIHHKVSWSYKGPTKPSRWGALSPEYKTCDDGDIQSPINIKRKTFDKELGKVNFSYHNSDLVLKHNGHTIQAMYEKNNFISFNGKRYDLLQFHFHMPSEHKINGVPYEMEMHLVHKSSEGDLAVVAVFFEEGDTTNKFIKKLWKILPEEKGENGPELRLNVKNILPKRKGYYTYLGSLTTPPCSEGVQWILLKHSIKLSSKELDKFNMVFRNNARPIQAVNARKIRETVFR